MTIYELRDLEEARRFLLQGLWWQRVVPPNKATVKEALEWCLEIASGGDPLPPVGFVADLGHVAFGEDWEARDARDQMAVPGLPINLVRTYEDHVLGKIYSDWTFSRASDALRRYTGRDRARGLAFLINQVRGRAELPGVVFAPGVIKQALDSQPEEVLAQGWEMLLQEGVQPLQVDLYEALITAVRRGAEVLAPEDIFELEHRTALADMGQRVALRQVLRATALLEAMLPRHRVKPLVHRMEVPTRILDEDTYPVGGFTSISTRGSVESLLQSQLAYMETDPGAERPDLFDIKFLRDELLYYSRDENQFLRRRRTFVLVLQPDLISSRFKDAALPYQRGVLLLALIRVLVLKLSEWLSSDALAFQILFVGSGERDVLAPERGLLETLLREQIANGTVILSRMPAAEVAGQCTRWARRSMCHVLNLAVQPGDIAANDCVVHRLQINGPRPFLADPYGELTPIEGEDALDSWGMALQQILQRWI